MALDPSQPLPSIPSDIEIAQAATLQPISLIAENAGLLEEEFEPYGKTQGKVSLAVLERLADRPDGKLILVTAMTATRAGEGKTVISIGLAQALGKLGVNHLLCLREPSLGPTFGIKGGAAGGGYAQVLPMENINMHFTGDLHAVTTAHNLLAAVIDNHVHYDNALDIDPERITWRRVLDLCDRQLRHCDIGLGSTFDGFPHRTGFDITAASEVMAVLALSASITDLRARLERMLVAYTRSGEPVQAVEFGCVGAMCVLLKDALKPNLVQTIEGTPALIHCGPFGNIAHGCNSLLATRMGLKLADYVVTEAGFAADLGAEKFLHIKCRQGGLTPAAAVFVVSCRALKMHGGVEAEELGDEDVEALVRGFANARVHIENLRKLGIEPVVAINRFPQDSPAELEAVRDAFETLRVPAALSEVAARGGEGGMALARLVVDAAENRPADFRPIYEASSGIREKIETLAREIYRADGVDYSPEAESAIARIEALGFEHLPPCVAKTQRSISDDPKRIGAPEGYRLKVRDLKISSGAGFIVVITGKVMLMPGMPRISWVEKIEIDADGRIHNLS